MSILEEMVSTEKCYTSDNNLPFRAAVARSEYLYQVRIYSEQAPYLPTDAGIQRMRVLLGFVEARCVVLDALIRSEGTLYYLSILCSSRASPSFFSAIMKKTAPRAVIEQVDNTNAETRMSARLVHRDSSEIIPFSKPVQALLESRKVLLSLLLEYRALMTECGAVVAGTESERVSSLNPFYTAPFLFFGKEGQRFAIPEFQVERISPGVNGSFLIEPYQVFGKRILVCDELLSTRDISVPSCVFGLKTGRGLYSVSAKGSMGIESFILVVPAYL